MDPTSYGSGHPPLMAHRVRAQREPPSSAVRATAPTVVDFNVNPVGCQRLERREVLFVLRRHFRLVLKFDDADDGSCVSEQEARVDSRASIQLHFRFDKDSALDAIIPEQIHQPGREMHLKRPFGADDLVHIGRSDRIRPSMTQLTTEESAIRHFWSLPETWVLAFGSKNGTFRAVISGKRLDAIFYRTDAGKEPVREWLKKFPFAESGPGELRSPSTLEADLMIFSNRKTWWPRPRRSL